MAEKKKKAPAGEAGHNTIDIPHEVIEPKPNGVAVTPIVETVDDTIRHEIAKFNIADSAIEQLKNVYGSLVINGPDDKDGYNKVRGAWSEIRTKRTGIEKKGLELRNQFKVVTTAISKEEDRLVALITPLEDELHKKWKAIDDEKERAKKEQEEAEGRKLMSRIEQLQTVGMSFKDGFYQIGDTITADVASLRAMPDETFEKLKAAVVKKAAELKKAADDEAELKRQAEAEQERQRQELKQQQEEIAEQQRQLKAQKDEMAKQLREMRLGKLFAIGMELEGTDVIKWQSVRLYIAPLIEMTADEFSRTVDTTAGQIKELKDKQAQEAETARLAKAERERKQKYMANCLEAAGLKYNWAAGTFNFANNFLDLVVVWEDLADLDEAAIALKAQEFGEQITKAKAQQQEWDDEKERENQAAEKLAMSDLQLWNKKLDKLAIDIMAFGPGEFKSDKFKKRAAAFMEKISDAIKDAK